MSGPPAAALSFVSSSTDRHIDIITNQTNNDDDEDDEDEQVLAFYLVDVVGLTARFRIHEMCHLVLLTYLVPVHNSGQLWYDGRYDT